ncbi:phosphate acetyltransferase [Pseudomonas nicosulfuronedens]|uniref:Phosphate acetyltransferase n=1 Tax=Pseudomonas nicosulfuronedens TaxID=2571105 RepID=A0A5R9RSB2_9PSED|nr:phosphate acetyltransferase [Pseudomonas nicosulfuronedens]MDH1008024.1 phosphate acetyltransferase [Pseudomonas nicosulfuronedens]MDH1978274.1 phosphate acetyltransferase [Pseudomonas nicosulfuronedens]MDH2025135.1 phosphate acetyltransferase [Pseudomonas nicosulfuronedens]TLX80630.1 phosphate acetyltransferase [Pseudomonas nicosulfuronedens]
MSLLDECRRAARLDPPRVVFPDGLDRRAIEAAQYLKREGLAQPLLLGNPFALRSYCLEQGVRLGEVPVLDPEHSPRIDAFVESLLQRQSKLTPEQACESLRSPLGFGAAMLEAGLVDLCIAGNLSSTADVLRAGLRVVGLEPGNRTLSSVFFMLPPDGGQPLAFADCGVIPRPTVEQLADITLSSAASFERVTGQPAKVAMLSFSSHGSARHPDAEAVRAACALVRERAPQLCVDGELQFDAAFVPQVAALKVPSSPLQGAANVFVFPSLEAGNIGYKIAQRLGGYRAIGPMLQGMRAALHDLSRGCSTEEMIQMVLLAGKMGGGAAAVNRVA